MDVGKLRHRVTLRTNTPSTDAGGGQVDSFANTVTVWGFVEPLRGTKRERAMGIDASVTHQIKVRYNSRITPDDELTYDSRTFRPSSIVNVDERNHVTEILAEEVL